jgi:hypothetical protein
MTWTVHYYHDDLEIPQGSAENGVQEVRTGTVHASLVT